MRWTVGVDIGGTFTDISVVGDDDSQFLWKQETTPQRLGEAIETGLAAVAGEIGLTLREFLAQTHSFVHGSTVATNTLIERNGPTVGLICTEGFRDALYFRDGFKWERFNVALPRPAEFVPRYLRRGVRERILTDGTVAQDLDAASVERVAAIFESQHVDSIAVALLWAHVNATHERRVRDILGSRLPGVPVILSSEILPEVGEWVRTSATVVSAYVYPRTATYLRDLAQWLKDNGLGPELQVMQVNGGCAQVEQALRIPVNIVHSGPAAAPAASRHITSSVDVQDALTIDMGGTSFEAGIMRGGRIPLSRSEMIAHQPIGVPAVEIKSIGAGGGSIAWVDSGGALRVGPRSAGARPGPAAYGQGTLPTVTDANVILGYLSTDAFLGGRRTLSAERAYDAISRHVAKPLGLDDPVAAAAGVIRVVDENMVNAIRAVTVERGIDPRTFALVSGGGAGSLHAARLAAALDIPRVFVPSQAGTLSAFGMTVSDVRHDYSATMFATTPDIDWQAAGELVAELEKRALADLRESGFADEDVRLDRYVDARYVGQVHELITPVPAGPLSASVLPQLVARFHELHRERYTYALDSSRIELLHWRVSGIGLNRAAPGRGFTSTSGAPVEVTQSGFRQAWFAELGGFVETPVYASDRIPAGAKIEGPAVVDSPTTTVLVPPGQVLLGDGAGSFLVNPG